MAPRIRIGLIPPSTNTTVEPDFRMAAPASVTIHTHRMYSGPEFSSENTDAMNSGVEQAARYLATAKVDVIVYACTGGSFYKGRGYDEELIQLIERTAGVPAVATAHAAAQALESLGVKNISVATPYPEWINEQLGTYYRQAGFNVLNVDGEPEASAAGPRDMCDQSPETVLEFAATACRPEAEALFCSCTGWRSMEVVEELERRVERPVVTSNQATIWAAFRRLGVTDVNPGYGSLMDSLALAVV